MLWCSKVEHRADEGLWCLRMNLPAGRGNLECAIANAFGDDDIGIGPTTLTWPVVTRRRSLHPARAVALILAFAEGHAAWHGSGNFVHREGQSAAGMIR